MKSKEEPLLGLATTKELLLELKARAEGFPHCIGEPALPKDIEKAFIDLGSHFLTLPGGLEYKTVGEH